MKGTRGKREYARIRLESRLQMVRVGAREVSYWIEFYPTVATFVQQPSRGNAGLQTCEELRCLNSAVERESNRNAEAIEAHPVGE